MFVIRERLYAHPVLQNYFNTEILLSSIHAMGNSAAFRTPKYEGWNFNSGNYLFTTDTK